VQPQNPSTGQNQQPGAAQALPPVPATPPEGTPEATPSTPEQLNEMPNAHPAYMDPTSVESWVVEVNNAVANTQHNPKQRADALYVIRSRYQRDVLGYKAPTREG
jgi:hypothetical protein